MYYEKEFVRRDETGNFVFSRLHRTERTTEAVQSITGRTRPVGTPHGTALRHQATELHARQYEMVIDILGKPEETDDDFREWPYDSNRNM